MIVFDNGEVTADHDNMAQTSLRADHIERLRPFLERQSEDCLNLNIYVPAILAWPPNNFLNVLVINDLVH